MINDQYNNNLKCKSKARFRQHHIRWQQRLYIPRTHCSLLSRVNGAGCAGRNMRNSAAGWLRSPGESERQQLPWWEDLEWLGGWGSLESSSALCGVKRISEALLVQCPHNVCGASGNLIQLGFPLLKWACGLHWRSSLATNTNGPVGLATSPFLTCTCHGGHFRNASIFHATLVPLFTRLKEMPVESKRCERYVIPVQVLMTCPILHLGTLEVNLSGFKPKKRWTSFHRKAAWCLLWCVRYSCCVVFQMFVCLEQIFWSWLQPASTWQKRSVICLSKFAKLQCEPLVLHLAVAGTWACFCGLIEPFADGDGSSLNVQISMTAGAVLIWKGETVSRMPWNNCMILV